MRVNCSEAQAETVKWPWHHRPWHRSYDHAAIRRGYHVYRDVCAQCHSIGLAYRHLVGVCFTEEEAKAEAANIEVEDGPDGQGHMFMRPGRLTDRLPAPYKNEEEARAANSGALPPDLTLITKARHGGPDYLFSLLTGYSKPPAGVEIKGSLHYNRYFPSGAIAMARNIYDDVVEYEDGTPATASQIAKDVTTFLSWASEPEMEERKVLGTKAMVVMTALSAVMWYWKRQKWSVLKSAQLMFRRPAGKT